MRPKEAEPFAEGESGHGTPYPPLTRRALLTQPREIRFQILEAQAEYAAREYELDTEERLLWQAGDFVAESEGTS